MRYKKPKEVFIWPDYEGDYLGQGAGFALSGEDDMKYVNDPDGSLTNSSKLISILQKTGAELKMVYVIEDDRWWVTIGEKTATRPTLTEALQDLINFGEAINRDE